MWYSLQRLIWHIKAVIKKKKHTAETSRGSLTFCSECQWHKHSGWWKTTKSIFQKCEPEGHSLKTWPNRKKHHRSVISFSYSTCFNVFTGKQLSAHQTLEYPCRVFLIRSCGLWNFAPCFPSRWRTPSPTSSAGRWGSGSSLLSVCPTHVPQSPDRPQQDTQRHS